MLVVSLKYSDLCKIIVVRQVRYTFVVTGVSFDVIEFELMSTLTVNFIDTLDGSLVRLS
jgi:hypothetical protein